MIEVIPAIDLIDGQVVRLQQGRYDQQQSFAKSPQDYLQEVEASGLQRLHLVNLSAAKEGRLKDLDLLQDLVQASPLKIDYGGGIKSEKDVELLLELGFDQVNVGSMIFRDFESFLQILHKYPEQLIASLDVKGERLMLDAWQMESEETIYDFLKGLKRRGLQHFCTTDIAKDGMMQGPSLDLYRQLKERFPELRLIASGGVRNRKDVEDLEALGVEAVIIGKAWLSGDLKLKDLC